VEVVKLAVPPLIVPEPRVVEPSRKVIVPVAVLGKLAVKVTDWLMVEGFSEDVSKTVGVAFVTVWLVVPVAELLFESPA
jgi:hypothetical protein